MLFTASISTTTLAATPSRCTYDARRGDDVTTSISTLKSTFQQLSIPLSAQKTTGPGTPLKFCSITLD